MPSSLAIRRQMAKCFRSLARPGSGAQSWSLRIAQNPPSTALSRRMRSLAAPGTAAAASELVNINEVDAYVLRPREGTDHSA